MLQGASGEAISQTLEGKVSKIIDGDTFDIQELRIRLCGVDAPGRGAPGWKPAKEKLSQLIKGRKITCIAVGGGSVCDSRSELFNGSQNGRFKIRMVAQCFIRKRDVAGLMVQAGMACDQPRYSNGHYGMACRKQ